MSLHRRAAKRDLNEAAIVDALRAVGVKVYRMSGEGLPDLLCEYLGHWTPLEVKSKGGKLTEAQAARFLESPFAVVRDAEQALAYFLPAARTRGSYRRREP